jgi:hypothetical protein
MGYEAGCRNLWVTSEQVMHGQFGGMASVPPKAGPKSLTTTSPTLLGQATVLAFSLTSLAQQVDEIPWRAIVAEVGGLFGAPRGRRGLGTDVGSSVSGGSLEVEAPRQRSRRKRSGRGVAAPRRDI